MASLFFFFGAQTARAGGAAGGTDRQDVPAQAPAQATDNERPPSEDSEADRSPSDNRTRPRLQLQDDSPDRDIDFAPRSRARAASTADLEEHPFWKSWIFWTVTGVLVAGVVGMVVYTSSGANSSLAPCPPDVVVSLGCFGTGR